MQICNSNNVLINIPRHLSGHLSGVSVSSRMLQMITCTYQKYQSGGILQILKISQSIIHYVRKIIRKNNISYPLIRTLSYAYRGVRNNSFLQNFASIINE